MDERKLIELAEEASAQAYAPYSGFQVGAAAVCENGRVYTGCNIENASYGLTVCAERVAIWKAVSEGAGKIKQLAVAGRRRQEEFRDQCVPCGSCRQVMAEFAAQDMKIILGRSNGGIYHYAMEALLPMGFRLEEADDSL